MLFSPRSAARSWFFDSNNLFVKLLSLALLGHILFVLSLFLSDRLGVQSITMSMKGARVTMLPGIKGGVGSQGAVAAGVQQSTNREPLKENVEELKCEEAVAAKKDTKKEESVKEKKKLSSLSELNKNRIAELPKGAKKEEKKSTKAEEKAPEFSQLKKEFSKLSKKKHESVDKKELSAKKLRSVDDEQKSSQPSAAKVADTVSQHTVAAVGGGGSHLSSYPTGGSVEYEMGEFVGEDASGYHDEFRQELAKYLRIPPGFEQHEPINISWDVQDGVVVYVSPQGSEPLVIYAAYKDAILKCSYPRLKYRKKYVYTFA